MDVETLARPLPAHAIGVAGISLTERSAGECHQRPEPGGGTINAVHLPQPTDSADVDFGQIATGALGEVTVTRAAFAPATHRSHVI